MGSRVEVTDQNLIEKFLKHLDREKKYIKRAEVKTINSSDRNLPISFSSTEITFETQERIIIGEEEVQSA